MTTSGIAPGGREEARAAARAARIPIGAVAVVIRLFDPPGDEVRRALTPPWPHWMHQLYAVESRGSSGGVDPQSGTTTLSAAITAVAERLAKRLEVASWVVSALDEGGWTCVLVGGLVVAHKICDPRWAREQLDRQGVYGPMTFVAELDDAGLPLLVSHAELR